MSNRVIKDSIRTNPKIASLTWFEEVLFYRLIVSADDYGCYEGRVPIVKNTLFPMKENVTNKSVENALNKLVKVGLVCRYAANDIPYLFIPSWEQHQMCRAKKRRYPEPTEDNIIQTGNHLQADVCNCMQMISDDFKKEEKDEKEREKEKVTQKEKDKEKEEREEKKKRVTKVTPKEKDPFVAFSDGDAELLDAFAGFEEMRKQIKKPLTTRAKNLAISTLQKYGSTKQEWIAILNQSTLNCWQGLFPVDRDNAGNKWKKFEYNNHFEEWESL